MNSVILGGTGNLITASCNAILGGANNSDGGKKYVGIFGNTVFANVDNAFHSNNYVVQFMPFTSGPARPNELYFTDPGTGFCPVFIL